MKNEALTILEEAISDVGNWRYWTLEDEQFQIEFGWVMLHIPTTEIDKSPSSLVALRFIDIQNLVILERNFIRTNLPTDWFEKLRKDEIEPFPVSHGEFSLTDLDEIKKYLYEAETKNFIVGNEAELLNSDNSGFNLGFWSGNVGLIVISKDFELVTINGKRSLGDVKEMHENWWNYWQAYWAKYDTKDSLPYDSLCEITIPAGADIKTKKWWKFWK